MEGSEVGRDVPTVARLLEAKVQKLDQEVHSRPFRVQFNVQ
jgi:hypothetical protein